MIDCRVQGPETLGTGIAICEHETLTGWWWVRWDNDPPNAYNGGSNPSLVPKSWLTLLPLPPAPEDAPDG